MVLSIFKAVLVGVVAAVPIGPILVMVIQRTTCYGRRCGFMVGLGAAVADTVYAAIGLMAVQMLQEFIEANTPWIMLIGGVFVALIGVGMLRRRVVVSREDGGGRMNPWTCFVQGLATTFSNPVAIGVMMALLALFGLGSVGVAFAPLVGLGEAIYWFVISWALSRFLRLDMCKLRTMSFIAGIAVCIFAVVLMGRGAWMLIGS